MINVSKQFKAEMNNDNRQFLPYLNITLKDGTVLNNLNGSDIWEGGVKIEEGVTASGEFTIGSCIINKLTVTLNNIYDKFSAYDFDRAIVTAHLGLKLPNGGIEKIRKGIFTVDDPKYNGAAITLECLDNMHKLDEDYSLVNTVYPATIGEIVRDICEFCGVPLQTAYFEGSNVVIQERPDDDSLSCRQILSYAAQRICKFARCNADGRIELSWFYQTVFEQGDRLDGGIFAEGSPYSGGDDADGGSFNPWNTGYKADAGTFEDQNEFHHLYSISSLDVSTDDVVITGVEVTEEFDETDSQKKSTCLYGEEGYVLSISENPFIGAGQAKTVAKYLGNKLIGLRFRPMKGSFLSDPTMEAGDLSYVTDYKQNTYHCLVTNLTFALGDYMQVSCDAKTPRRNSTKSYSELTKAILKMRKETKAQISAYDTSVQQMNQLAANTFGYHFTVVKQDDGSIISYQHDKPTLAESKTVYKKGIDGFFVTRNYTGKDSTTVWTSGFDSSGNVVLNILSVIGFYFDWAKGGTLTLGGYNNESGVLKILDAKGNLLAELDAEGLHFYMSYIDEDNKDSFTINRHGILFSYYDTEVFGQDVGIHTDLDKKTVDIFCSNLKTEKDAFIYGNQTVRGNQTVEETQTVRGNQTVEGTQTVKSTSLFHRPPRISSLSYKTDCVHVVRMSDGTLALDALSSLRYKSVGKMVTSEDVEPLYTLPVNWAKYKEGFLGEQDERNNTYYPMFIAEEVHNHFPLAADHKDGKPENWNHRVLIPCMMKMIQDQKKRNDKLEERISKLEKMIGGGSNGNPE